MLLLLLFDGAEEAAAAALFSCVIALSFIALACCYAFIFDNICICTSMFGSSFFCCCCCIAEFASYYDNIWFYTDIYCIICCVAISCYVICGCATGCCC